MSHGIFPQSRARVPQLYAGPQQENFGQPANRGFCYRWRWRFGRGPAGELWHLLFVGAVKFVHKIVSLILDAATFNARVEGQFFSQRFPCVSCERLRNLKMREASAAYLLNA